ncbi:MAG: FxLYD domain-containing protein [Bacilli bacterium]|nr:FxLYD domain-containing protein [Bacilli bacterium]
MKIVKNLLNYKYSKIILGTLLVVLVAVPLLFTNNKPKNQGKKIAQSQDAETFAHTEENIIKEEEYEGLKITNITLITDKGYTTFSADVTNTREEPTNFENVNIELQDKDGNTVITLLGNIGTGLKKGETRTITASAKGEFKTVTAKSITPYQG